MHKKTSLSMCKKQKTQKNNSNPCNFFSFMLKLYYLMEREIPVKERKMKNWLKVLVAVVLALTCMFAFAACDNSDGDQNADQSGGDNISGGDSNVPGGSGTIEDLEEGYKVNFYYSYTAIVVNASDRTEEKNERKLVETIYVPYDNTGWSAEDLATKDAITYNGYKFEAWYPEWDEETETGWNNKVKPQVAVGDPYNFDKPVTDDINLYAYKGVIAGDDIVWDIVYDYQTEAAITPADYDPNSQVLVTFVSVDKTLNITNNVSHLTVAVPKATGWDDALKGKKDAIKYNGYVFTNWYTAENWDEEKMEPTGDAYAFDSIPTENITLYGVIGTEADANAEATALKVVEGILTLTGSGAMYDFANRSVVDVPWYDHRADITIVNMDDEITYIGQNAFAGFKSLAEFNFPEKVTKIGDFAFYEANSKSFKTLRLPENITEIGANAFAYTSFTQVYLNDALTTISQRAFYASNNIKYIVVPSGLTYIGSAAFHPGPGNYQGTPNANHDLAKVYYNGDESKLTRAADGSNTVTFAGLKIEIENDWFNKIPAVYSYFKAEEGETVTAEQTKSSWYLLESKKDGVEYPAQYSYTVKYMLPNNLVAFAVDYVTINPVYDDAGNPVLNADGDATFQGTVSDDNIKFMNELMHKDGYGFYDFDVGGTPFELGSPVTEDRSITCNRYTTQGGVSTGYLGGGITWTLNAGTLTVSPGDVEKGATNIAWDLVNSEAAATLWNGSAKGPATITKIVVEEGVKELGNYVFTGTAIKDITLPASLKTIASNAFDNCTSLHSVYFAGTDISESVASLELPKDARVYAKAPEAYNGEIGAYWLETKVNEDNIYTAWQIDDKGNLYVGGNEIMKDYVVASDAPWYKAKDKITSVTVSTNITDLADNLVSGYAGVQNIVLHAKVKVVPESAFEGTGIVNNLHEYKNGMLVVNGVLIKVDPARRNSEFFATNTNISVIADGAFSRCDNIKSVYLANTVKYVNPNAFDDVVALERLYIDNGKSSWESASSEFVYDVNKVQILLSGDWRAQNGVYSIRRCNHVYGDYTTVKESTCCVAGYKERACVFGERCCDNYTEGQTHVLDRQYLELDKVDGHNFFVHTEDYHDAEGKLHQKFACNNTYQTEGEDGELIDVTCSEINDVVVDITFGEYESNNDGTETAKCTCTACANSETPVTDTRDIVTEGTVTQ